MWRCFKSTKSMLLVAHLCPPTRYVYVSLSLKNSLSIHVVYVSFSLYLMTLKYVTLCRNLVRQWCLKSTKSKLLVTHLSPPKVHVCFSFFEKIIFHPCSICLVLFVLYDIDLCYFMQAYSEAAVLEENQVNVVGDPPLPPPGTCMSHFLLKIHCLSM